MRGLLKTYQLKNGFGGGPARQEEINRLVKDSLNTKSGNLGEKGKSEQFLDPDRPKTKEEKKMEAIKEKERQRVARAADRRENWVSMVANDPDFVQGFQQGALPLFHADHVKFRDFSAPGRGGLQGSVVKSSMDKKLIGQFPTYTHTDYSDKQPCHHNDFRHRNFIKETATPIMKYTHKDQLERIADKIQGTPKLSTEPLNTLLLIKPKWREHDESKWVGGKEFQSMMSKKDQGWQPLNNISQDYPEPYVHHNVKFRDTGSSAAVVIAPLVPVLSSPQKYRNLSNIRTQAQPQNPNSMFKQSPAHNRSRGSHGDDSPLYEESPTNARNHNSVMFDSTVPNDKTWKNRAIQSNSLRQKHHLNQSLKLRKNLLQHKDSANQIIDMRTQIAMSQPDSPIGGAGAQIMEFKPTITIQEEPESQRDPVLATPGRKSYNTKPQSPFTQQTSYSPCKISIPGSSQVKQKPPLPKKDQVIALDKLAPDVPASYLNNDFIQSYPNAWQYSVVVKAPTTYQNQKFEETEELRESHILWEMDREKTYFRSAMERISPQKIKDQMGTDKFRRTSQFMALNTCVMDKTAVIEHDNLSHTKATNSFKKLPNNSLQKRKSSRKQGERQEQGGGDVYDQTNISPFIQTSGKSSAGGQSPIKLMSMTMPKGFMSPKNGVTNSNSKKKETKEQMNKQEIKNVVKSYFDKTPTTVASPSMLAPPLGGGSSPRHSVMSPQAPPTANGSLFERDTRQPEIQINLAHLTK